MDEAIARKAKNIKVLFRGVNKDNPHKAIVGVQAEKGVIGKHIQENFDNFKKNGADMSTAVLSTWLKWNVSYFYQYIFRWLKLLLDSLY